MNDHNLTIGVGGFVQNNENHVLLIERLKQPGIWTLPSGYVENCENIYQTLIRELQEEVNIIVSPRGVIGLRQLHNDKEYNNLWIIVRAHHVSGELKADMKEVSRAAFFKIQDALCKKLTEVTRRILSTELESRLVELDLQKDISSKQYLFFS